MPIFPAFRRWRQKDQEFKDNLGYRKHLKKRNRRQSSRVASRRERRKKRRKAGWLVAQLRSQRMRWRTEGGKGTWLTHDPSRRV